MKTIGILIGREPRKVRLGELELRPRRIKAIIIKVVFYE
jgi:hypothetical protein